MSMDAQIAITVITRYVCQNLPFNKTRERRPQFLPRVTSLRLHPVSYCLRSFCSFSELALLQKAGAPDPGEPHHQIKARICPEY